MGETDLIILDLDGTIYNWTDYYAPAFKRMLGELESLSNKDKGALKQQFKEVHMEHGTIEYAFSLQELDSEIDVDSSGESIEERFESAIRAFREAREDHLTTFRDVEQTLIWLKNNGYSIVAYTDGMLYYTSARLSYLDLEQYFDGVVALKNHKIPERATDDLLRDVNWGYEADVNYIWPIHPKDSKPNSEVLCGILDEYSVQPSEAIYVGDSLTKDILPAQKCGIEDVHAEYGNNHDRDNFELLVDISHWSEDEIENARKPSEVEVKPTNRIYSFSELMDIVATKPLYD